MVDNIGSKYSNGQGVQRDYQKAMEYYLLSANQGNEAALYNIGIDPFFSFLFFFFLFF